MAALKPAGYADGNVKIVFIRQALVLCFKVNDSNIKLADLLYNFLDFSGLQLKTLA